MCGRTANHHYLVEEEAMLMRFDPFRELDRLTEQVWRGGRATMPIDAYRQGDQFSVHLDLPGVDPGSIDLSVERDVLTVSAKREWQPGDDVDVIVSARPHGTFTRQLFLGGGLEADRVEAGYDGGVLSVRIPVAEQAKPRKVEITSAGATKQLETTSA